jgi:hypothetical protein
MDKTSRAVALTSACLLLFSATPAVPAQVNIGISINAFPELVRIPGYPVYYAPRMNSNYFFYDGNYWVFQDDDWYTGTWYDGPWDYVDPEYVPLYLLQVPVRYYRRPPAYFRGWQGNAQPRWADHWGNEWAQQRSGWDRHDRGARQSAAPLPTYQRRYSGTRYPQATQQENLQNRNYRYQPRERVVTSDRPTHRSTDDRSQSHRNDSPREQQNRDSQRRDRRDDNRNNDSGEDNNRDNGRDNGRDH